MIEWLLLGFGLGSVFSILMYEWVIYPIIKVVVHKHEKRP